MTKILIHLAEGFEETEAIAPADVFRRAGYELTLVSVTGKREVTGAHGITVLADKLFEEINYADVDMIVLPGGMPGAKNLNAHRALKAQIMNFSLSGKPLAAICAAPLVFGHLGILKGKKATCYPGFEDQLTGAIHTGKPVEVDGELITGKGPGAALAFAFAIVEKFSGKEKAASIAKAMIAG